LGSNAYITENSVQYLFEPKSQNIYYGISVSQLPHKSVNLGLRVPVQNGGRNFFQSTRVKNTAVIFGKLDFRILHEDVEPAGKVSGYHNPGKNTV
jgi:hypothetical protein